MRKYDNGQILYSASDLVSFLGCRHASFLSVQALNEAMRDFDTNPINQLLQQQGLQHEIAYLQSLKDEGKTVVEIAKDYNLPDRSTLTLDAMRSGVEVIYQAAFLHAPWHGYADFLIKCDAPSALGDFSYEVLDTKLARTAEPKHIMQLCVYSDLLTKLQDFCALNMHLFLGDGEKYSFRVKDFFHYYRHAKKQFESYIQVPPAKSYPEPCSHCNTCQWHDPCNVQWETDNHLSLVANIQHSQRDKLQKAGITTLADLVATPPDTKIPDLNRAVFLRLHAQARLQHHKAITGENKLEILAALPHKGFARMPAPNDSDLFFDMEGDPLYPGGLEYLFGLHYCKGGEAIFKPFWAHNPTQEKQSFARFMAFLADHLSAHPNAYIYHYNHYETTALKRLACRYGVCEEQLDNLLRNQKFIDLYLVVRESIRISEPGYSIKNLETFYMEKREDAVATAEDSIISYNEWRITGASALLEKIEKYNQVDCKSTHLLRDWLLQHRADDIAWLQGVAEEEERQRKDWEIEYEDYQNRLCQSGLGQNGLDMSSADPFPINQRLADLLEFHNREAKPQWWSAFDRQNRFEDELIDDIECLGGLQQISQPIPEKRSLIYSYRFPAQEYKLKVGAQAVDTATMESAGTICKIDDVAGIVKIKRGNKKEALAKRLSIGPSGPIDSKLIRSAIYRYAGHVLATPTESHAATELLMRNVPRIQGKQAGMDIITSQNLQSDALEAIAALDNSYMFIQGPPGAGKTYISSHIIMELIKRGKKIGVASNSHKAIHNLLAKIEAVATAVKAPFVGVKKASKGNAESFYQGQFICSAVKTDAIDLGADLFAGTAWTFAHQHFANQLDYLFIDEAGQVSTANVVAMTNASKNTILVGDQIQLGQPIQGVHPGDAGLSVLEFLLGDHATIPAERGIFLGQTYRMRPSICQFISNAFYDGRLTSDQSTKQRRLNLQGVDLPNEGIVMLSVQHDNCSQKSVQEGAVIKAQYQKLLGQDFTEPKGTTRPITTDDILVVTPYNVQANYLRSILVSDARVGTVDKFQGQEAAIVLISMVTSSAEDLPRNIEFLYSKNRLNVAISRAQCLVVVVASAKLFAAPCKTVEQMKLVNTFCWLEQYAFKLD